MKRIILNGTVLATALLVSSISLAEQQKPGPYIGALLGSTHFSVNDLDYSTNKFTWGGFAGWQFNSFAGMELGYMGTKKISEDLDSGAHLTIKPTAISASALGTYPLGEVWSLYGRIGAARAKLKATASDGEDSGSASNATTELTYGAGIGAMIDGAKVRLEYQRIQGDDVKTRLLSLGIVWFLPYR